MVGCGMKEWVWDSMKSIEEWRGQEEGKLGAVGSWDQLCMCAEFNVLSRYMQLKEKFQITEERVLGQILQIFFIYVQIREG
jgi:hypothetical protein